MAFGDWLALLSPVVAIMVAFFGFRRSTRADQLAAFFQLQDRYLAHEVRTGRRLVHEQVSGRSASDIENLPDDVRTAIGYTLAVLNAIAIACEARYVDRRAVVQSMGRSYASAMTAAKPFIDHVEQKRGVRPYGYAERLAAAVGSNHVTPTTAPPSPEPGEADRVVRG